eukprot:2256860-Alexandrium_andersonii.AAC.1
MARPRAEFQLEELKRIIEPWCTALRWLEYGEDINKSKRQPKLLQAKLRLYEAIGAVTGNNLTFRKKDLTNLFSELVGVGGPLQAWFKEPGHAQDWAETMCKRMMVQCRHISSAMKQKSPPSWIR